MVRSPVSSRPEVPLQLDPIPSSPAGAARTETCEAPAPAADPASFDSLGLSPESLATVAAAGFTTPTPVQARAIPPALAGRDVIACAATGTGKTAAFVLPIVERLVAHPGRRTSRVLVLAPTRELVQQIAETFAVFGRDRGIRSSYVVGGLAFGPQAKALSERRHVVVATPGRLLDHLDRGNVRLDDIEVLVLDEADRMLDLGFRPQLDAILGALPAERQSLLFSATIGREVAAFAQRCLRDPVHVQVVRAGTVAHRAEQRVFHVDQRSKPDLLLSLLSTGAESTLVFTRTKHRAERLAKVLDRAGHAVARIHGDRSQAQRQAALEDFRSGKVRVLVATDVAARGLDIADIAHVVNFDLSLVPEDYVHRVGRTARADSSGLATSFCSAEETQLLRNIEKLTRVPIAAAQVPDGIAALPVPAPAAERSPRGSRDDRPRSSGYGRRPGRNAPRGRADDRGGDRVVEDAPRDDAPAPEVPHREAPRPAPHRSAPHRGGPRPWRQDRPWRDGDRGPRQERRPGQGGDARRAPPDRSRPSHDAPRHGDAGHARPDGDHRTQWRPGAGGGRAEWRSDRGDHRPATGPGGGHASDRGGRGRRDDVPSGQRRSGPGPRFGGSGPRHGGKGPRFGGQGPRFGGPERGPNRGKRFGRRPR